MTRDKRYLIDQPDQIASLASPMRQEIVDSIQASGPSSVADLARQLGCPADSLYYHVARLAEAGLLIEHGVRRSGRKDEAVYDLPGPGMRLHYDPSDPENVSAVNKVIVSMLRVAERDFRAGFNPELAVVEGAGRNLRGYRAKAWLTEEELGELNELLERIDAILTRAKDPGPRRLHAFTWVLSPAKARAPRRAAAARERVEGAPKSQTVSL